MTVKTETRALGGAEQELFEVKIQLLLPAGTTVSQALEIVAFATAKDGVAEVVCGFGAGAKILDKKRKGCIGFSNAPIPKNATEVTVLVAKGGPAEDVQLLAEQQVEVWRALKVSSHAEAMARLTKKRGRP